MEPKQEKEMFYGSVHGHSVSELRIGRRICVHPSRSGAFAPTQVLTLRMLQRPGQAHSGESYRSDDAGHTGALIIAQTRSQPTMLRWTVVSVRSEQRRPIKSPSRFSCRPFEASASLLGEPTHRARKASLRQCPHLASLHKPCPRLSSSPSATPAPGLCALSASAARRPCSARQRRPFKRMRGRNGPWLPASRLW